MRSLAILIAAITLSGCSAMMLGGGSTASTPMERDRATPAAQASDSTLSSRVRAQYAKDPMLAQAAITVSAAAGMVTLSGTVSTYAARESAEKLAMATDGVKGVDNNITVNYEK
ncbi:MAG: BON domain-containing protein [Gammaproteobacteria bacterium]|nr:BON domain-containing protein [Gammaproteobacteria bacterium]MDH5302845.1 BON domain-containing protein [Gammaproteobacteria bacterium]MDH5323073.1 BON domain-containing protein [Gammaproteobacteria bacterium]